MKVDYVTWLRSRVGHQKVFLVRACGIVTDAEGRVLLQRHPDWGWWELPGGPLEPGERLSACLVRGLRETGLTVEPTRLVGLYTSADFDLTYPNGDQVQQFIACFACRVTGGQWPASATCFSPTALPDLPAWDRAMIEDYAANTPAASFRRGSSGSPISHEHILHLRQFVGRERLMITGGAGLVRNEAGQVLFIRRSDDGMWALPAGAMELGERVDRAVEREVGEETGLVVRAERLIGVYAGGPAFRHTYPNGDQTVLVSTFFDCRVMGGALCADNDEALEVRFFPPDRLPPLLEFHSIRIRDGLAGREAACFQ
jgi:ADP-ribose pyrophosphatase YjhB (NUDIX family)